MNKEEAKKELAWWFTPDDFPNRDLVVYEVSKLIDAIEPEHKKVVLPKAVGEQWDKLVSYNSTIVQPGDELDSALVDIITSRPDQDTEALYGWLADTWNAYSKLIDAARYGWVPKPDKLYRVKVYGIDLPGLFYWKRDDGTLSFVQGGAGQPETQFTMSEIKHRHLENCEREEVIDDDAKK